MNTPRAFSDEDLTAFLDGEADATLEAEIVAALETDEELGARMAGLELPMDAIKGAFDSMLDTAPAMPALPETASAMPQPA
ncbi:MAG: transcriptional regulator, partial [Pseudomonadota bacterium]